jgi:hypothetical protein
VILRISWSLKSYKYMYLKRVTNGHRIAKYDCMLKILRFDDNTSTIFALSGRIEESDLPELQTVLDAEPKMIADLTLDLQEVRLVSREAGRFLATCEAKGIKLKNCPGYIDELLRVGRETGDEQH